MCENLLFSEGCLNIRPHVTSIENPILQYLRCLHAVDTTVRHYADGIDGLV